jgi:hypothetical protein
MHWVTDGDGAWTAGAVAEVTAEPATEPATEPAIPSETAAATGLLAMASAWTCQSLETWPGRPNPHHRPAWLEAPVVARRATGECGLVDRKTRVADGAAAAAASCDRIWRASLSLSLNRIDRATSVSEERKSRHPDTEIRRKNTD